MVGDYETKGYSPGKGQSKGSRAYGGGVGGGGSEPWRCWSEGRRSTTDLPAMSKVRITDHNNKAPSTSEGLGHKEGSKDSKQSVQECLTWRPSLLQRPLLVFVGAIVTTGGVFGTL